MLRRLMRCRRGSVSVMFALGIGPLIGFAALGTEAGSWYTAKIHAQNAADAAAIAGALALASGLNATDHAKAVARANGFCEGIGCPSLPPGVTQSVSITPTATTVTATIGQHKPLLLSKVIMVGQVEVNIVSTATAAMLAPPDLCILSRQTMKVAGNFGMTGSGCSMMTNTNIILASAPVLPTDSAILAVSGCGNSANICSSVPDSNWHMPVASLPPALVAIQAETTFPASSGAGNINCHETGQGLSGCSISPYETSHHTIGNLSVGNNATLDLPSGTYFFDDSSISIQGTLINSDGGGVNLVLRGTSSLDVKGTMQLKAMHYNAGFDHVLNDVLIYDSATGTVNTSANSATSYYGGALYFPNADVTFGGNAATGLNCTTVVANTLSLSGTSSFATSGCGTGLLPTYPIVMLTQ